MKMKDQDSVDVVEEEVEEEVEDGDEAVGVADTMVQGITERIITTQSGTWIQQYMWEALEKK